MGKIYPPERFPLQNREIQAMGESRQMYKNPFPKKDSTPSKGYAPKIFTNPNGSNSNSDSEVEPLGSGSKPPSDWDDDLIDLTQIDNASHQNTNPGDGSDEDNLGSIANAQLQTTPRQPPPGWVSWRKEASPPVDSQDKPQENNAAMPAVSNNNSVNKLTIEEAQTITKEEFLNID